MLLKENFYYLGKMLAVTICLCFLVLHATRATAEEQLHGIWSDLLERNVSDGVVDYQAMKKNESLLDEYLDKLDATDPEKLPEKARLAFYINAYNAYTVKLIIDNFEDGKPVESIKDLGGFFSGPWDIEFCRIGGKVYTLDNIEHDIIRPQFNEPRIHFAINCAAQSCPPLISEAYVASRLDEQLQNNTVNFLNDKEFNRLEDKTLYVTKIFKWFSEDFNDDVVGFVRRYAQGDFKSKLQELGDEVRVKYLDYDWSLNNS